jgi:hypothetical protein
MNCYRVLRKQERRGSEDQEIPGSDRTVATHYVHQRRGATTLDLEDFGPQGSVCIVNGNSLLYSIVTYSSVIRLQLVGYLPWLYFRVSPDKF